MSSTSTPGHGERDAERRSRHIGEGFCGDEQLWGDFQDSEMNQLNQETLVCLQLLRDEFVFDGVEKFHNKTSQIHTCLHFST